MSSPEPLAGSLAGGDAGEREERSEDRSAMKVRHLPELQSNPVCTLRQNQAVMLWRIRFCGVCRFGTGKKGAVSSARHVLPRTLESP